MDEGDLEQCACFCGTHDTTAVVIKSRDGGSLQDFLYRTCAACGAERVSPRPVNTAIGAYYPLAYASHVVRPSSSADRIKRLTYLTFYAPENRLGALRPLLRLLLFPIRGHSVFAFHPVEPRRVYEFGAATGNDLVLFRQEGWQIGGCEPSERACKIAAERGIALENCPAEAVELAAGSSSAVLINNVLEHTHDPASILAACWKGLVPGGSVIVVVPNHAGPSARIFGAAWPGYDGPRHLWGFTPSSLGTLLQQVGFNVPQVHQMFQGPWAWQSCLDGRHSAKPVAVWRKRWARPLSLALYPIGILGALFGQGDFMTVVATKPLG